MSAVGGKRARQYVGGQAASAQHGFKPCFVPWKHGFKPCLSLHPPSFILFGDSVEDDLRTQCLARNAHFTGVSPSFGA
jgi:hypothetical protein